MLTIALTHMLVYQKYMYIKWRIVK